MNSKKSLLVGCGALILGILAGVVGGYSAGTSAGHIAGDAAGYSRAQEEIKKAEELAGKKATDAAAKAANPFQSVNPLEGVEADPFEKAKKVLNPFE